MSMGGHCDVDNSSLNSLEPIEYLARVKRSRNAAAQARLRARQKSYIEFLEQKVMKLQSILAPSPDQVNDITSPLQIQDLRQQNELLLREVEELRRQLKVRNAQPRLAPSQHLHTPLYDGRPFYRETNQCSRAEAKGTYVTPAHNHPPPLLPSISSITGKVPSQVSYIPDYQPSLPGYTEPPQTAISRGASSSFVSESVASVPAPSVQHSAYVPALLPSKRLNLPLLYGQPYPPTVGQQPSPHVITPNTTCQTSWVTEGGPKCTGYVQ